MTNEKKLSDELLKQNGMKSRTSSKEDQTKLYRKIDLEKRRVTRMKWATAVSWILMVIVNITGIAMHFAGPNQALTSVQTMIPSYVFTLANIILWWVAIICTASLVIRIFRLRGFRQEQIIESLSTIQERLKRLEEKK